MNKIGKTALWGKWFVVFASTLIIYISMSAMHAYAAGVDTTNNNFTMTDPGGNMVGGTNDVHFTWDGTMKTSVAVSGQVSNATLSSSTPFFGTPWSAHDVTIYTAGTYTVDTSCPAGSPGCTGTGPTITFTVGVGELGAHMLFDYAPTTNIDVVNVWTPKAVFGPSPMWTGAGGSNPDTKVWDWMSKDFDGDTFNGTPMVDGPFPAFNANFNVMGVPPLCSPCSDAATRCDDGNVCTADSCDCNTGLCSHVNNTAPCDDHDACTIGDVCSNGACKPGNTKNCDDNNVCTTDSCDSVAGCVHTNNTAACDDGNACTTADTCSDGVCVGTPTAGPGCNTGVDTTGNNFTMIDSQGSKVGGTNDVRFTWDGTLKTSVAASGQVSNATLSSSTPFFGYTWSAHDVAIYGPGTYTVYTNCSAGSPGCGDTTTPTITFTVGPDELGAHMLFNWSVSKDIDVVDIWTPKAVFGPSPMWTGAGGSNSASIKWDWMAKDSNGDGFNGRPMVDGPFIGFNANFNVMVTTNHPPVAPILVSPAVGETGLDTTVEFRWKKSTDPDNDALKYIISYSTSTNAEGGTSVTASRSGKGMFYAGGAGLLMIGMTFIGSLTRRKNTALLLVIALAAGGALMSCGNSKTVSGRDLPIDELSYKVSGLNPNTTYYWKVTADDGKGRGTAESTVQSFRTK